jgi:hypothetical protein
MKIDHVVTDDYLGHRGGHAALTTKGLVSGRSGVPATPTSSEERLLDGAFACPVSVILPLDDLLGSNRVAKLRENYPNPDSINDRQRGLFARSACSGCLLRAGMRDGRGRYSYAVRYGVLFLNQSGSLRK